MPFTPQAKKAGDLVRSQDWNDAMQEIVRLETAKVNRAGGDTIAGSLAIDGTLRVATINHTELNFQIGGVTKLAIANNGNVGIGTTNPGAKLEVSGNLTVQGNVAVSGTVDGRDVSADGTKLDNHASNTNNPHNTTAVQVGALPITGGALSGALSVTLNQGGTAIQTTVASSSSTNNIGFFNSVAGIGDRTARGIYNTLNIAGRDSGTGYVSQYGLQNQIQVSNAGNQSIWGLYNVISGDDAAGSKSYRYGLVSSVSGGLGSNFGLSSGVSGDGGGHTGLSSSVSGDGGGHAGISSQLSCGTTATNYGIFNSTSAASGTTYGLYNNANNSGDGTVVGIYTTASNSSSASTSNAKYGIYAAASGPGTNWAGYFVGDVRVTGNLTVNGTLSKGSGGFLIDHPLDPENKTLYHNFVESPESLCLYRGKAKLNTKGEAVVHLPDYFAALTKEEEATVTLTPIGKEPFATSYEWNSECTGFTVYGNPGSEVSYIVLADRDDPAARADRQPVEATKEKSGKFLHPEAYGRSRPRYEQRTFKPKPLAVPVAPPPQPPTPPELPTPPEPPTLPEPPPL